MEQCEYEKNKIFALKIVFILRNKSNCPILTLGNNREKKGPDTHMPSFVKYSVQCSDVT